MIEFNGLFNTVYGYTLEFPTTHTHTDTLMSTVMSSLAVAQ
jgi:hypothetical protein